MIFRCNGVKNLYNFPRLLLYSSSSSTHSFRDYLVDSLGFSNQESLSLSEKLTRVRLQQGAKKVTASESILKSNSVITFLKKNGFDQSHIRQIVSYHPRILHSQIDKTLNPKIQFLRDQGLSGSDLVQFVTNNPVVVTLCLNSCTLPAIEALKEALGDHETAIAAVKRLRHSSVWGVAYNVVPNVALLRSYGVSLKSIRKHIAKQPHAYVRDTKTFSDLLVRVEEKWGISRYSAMFLYGINLLSGMKQESIDSKVEVFTAFGWTELDVQTIVRTHPNCLQSSALKIRKTLEFLMTELGYKPNIIAMRPGLFICSLEKRIIPRHKILVFLKEKGLISKEAYPLYNVVSLVETVFLRRFVLPYKEVYELYNETTGRSVQLLMKAQAEDSSTKIKS